MLSSDDEKFLKDMFLSKFDLEQKDIDAIFESASLISLEKGNVLYENSKSCYGYIIVKKGILRAYITSETLKEITIFMIKEGESCIMCASCQVESFNKKLNLEALENCEFILIPKFIFKEIRHKYESVADHATMLVATRFDTLVSVLQLALFSPLIARIKNFLNENSKDGIISITHEELANHIGSAREAVSRTLKDMEKNGEISQKRGIIRIIQ
ncbi:MAG: Crp/Fnr family transcriptional regulator [Campylobacter sp.]|nr:Crp/Fnr family transcriptional regulator [Campylobacter sp.]